MDRRLYLPEEWCADQERRERAKIPDTVQFQTKPELALNMLMHAWEQGMPMQWVTGDELYGDSTAFRETVAANGRWYVVAVRSNMAVWVTRPAVVLPGYAGQGRPSTRLQLAPDAPRATIVNAVVAAWPESRWQRLTVHEGTKGPVAYDWACQRIVESCEQLPGRDAWLVARRSVSNPNEIAYYLSNAPADIPLATLARVASTRYTVEQCFEEAKGDTGLDHYEVRHWHSWHRHITLINDGSCVVGCDSPQGSRRKRGRVPFLAPLTVREVRRLLEIALPLPSRSLEFHLAWSSWRCAKRLQARRNHTRSRLLALSIPLSNGRLRYQLRL